MTMINDSTETTETTASLGISILPFYLVADVSGSMQNGGCIGVLNSLLPQLRDELRRSPVVGDIVNISLIDFSDDARVVLGLTDLRSVETLPVLTTRGGTVFSAGLNALRVQIEADYVAAKEAGFEVKRPTAVFLSDGGPTDATATWQAAFDALTVYDPETGHGFRRFPNLIPIGIGAADRGVMSSLRYRKDGPAAMPALFMQDGGDPARAIADLIPVLIRSIVNSSLAAQSSTAPDASAKAMADELANAQGFDIELD